MNGNLFFTKKPPFHRLITVVRKQCQTTVILTVPSVLRPYGLIFMEPGFVSCRLIRPVIPKSFLVKLTCGLIPRREPICRSGSGRFVPVRVLLSGTTQQANKPKIDSPEPSLVVLE